MGAVFKMRKKLRGKNGKANILYYYDNLNLMKINIFKFVIQADGASLSVFSAVYSLSEKQSICSSKFSCFTLEMLLKKHLSKKLPVVQSAIKSYSNKDIRVSKYLPKVINESTRLISSVLS